MQLGIGGWLHSQLTILPCSIDPGNRIWMPMGCLVDPTEKLPTDDVTLKEQNRIRNFTERLTKNYSENELSDDVVKAICESWLIQWLECPNDFPAAFVSSLAMQETVVPDAYAQEDNCGGLPLIPNLSLSEVHNAQLADPCIRLPNFKLENSLRVP